MMKRLFFALCLMALVEPLLAAATRRDAQLALRTSLSQASVRAAIDAEVRRQLATVRPIALVKGYWVTPIDLSPVYGKANVVSIPTGPQIALVFTPNQLAGQFQIPRANIFKMVGVNAALEGMAAGSYMNPSGSGYDVKAIIGYIEAGFDWLMGFFQNWEHDREVKNNQKNCQDKGPDGDCDGDGKKNKDDGCPNDPDPSCVGGGSFVGCMIITCQRRVFTTEFGTSIDSLIDQVATQIRQSTQAGTAVSLGGAGVSSSIRIAFPPAIR